LIGTSLDITGPSNDFNMIADTGVNIHGTTADYSATDMVIESSDNIRITGENRLDIFALNDFTIGFDQTFADTFAYHDGRGDVYFTYDQDSGQESIVSDVFMTANQVRFFAPLVDFTSTISLVFPIETNANTVPCVLGRFYLQEIPDIFGTLIPSICYCSQNAPLTTRKCYRLFRT